MKLNLQKLWATALILFAICGCSQLLEKITNMTEMPKESKAYTVFLPDILSFVDSSKYELIPTKKGLKFPYCKMENNFGGLSISCRAQYKDKSSGQLVSFMTAISVTPTKKQAISLFNTEKKLGAFYKKSIIPISNVFYKMENAFCIQDSSRFYILLQKEKFLISYDIDNISGFSLSENEMKELLVLKINNAILQFYTNRKDN